ncbi:hypothetical protein JO972_10285 [Verrucomicrobiaceae bacterium 5K15]|uniref:Lipoprotein n=2 Tax=Oceaniferula flava TaxID=2800421 RepID=A0AAE2SE70_9BACT|nr:hypothetical protein [Oceaniferula flavus]MBM1136653.1 hypothetical protein [Oceaniferula flavus]
MKNFTTMLTLTALAGISVIASSCANKEAEVDTTDAPLAIVIEEPEVEVPRRNSRQRSSQRRVAATAKPQNYNATAAFLVPKSDTNLPTKEQLAEGKESSIGLGSSSTNVTNPVDQPSAAIKPPSAAPAE